MLAGGTLFGRGWLGGREGEGADDEVRADAARDTGGDDRGGAGGDERGGAGARGGMRELGVDGGFDAGRGRGSGRSSPALRSSGRRTSIVPSIVGSSPSSGIATFGSVFSSSLGPLMVGAGAYHQMRWLRAQETNQRTEGVTRSSEPTSASNASGVNRATSATSLGCATKGPSLCPW